MLQFLGWVSGFLIGLSISTEGDPKTSWLTPILGMLGMIIAAIVLIASVVNLATNNKPADLSHTPTLEAPLH